MTDHRAAGEAFTKHLVVVLLVAAANKEATKRQRELIRSTVLPIVQDTKRPLTHVVVQVRRIMGPEWRPTGDHGAYLDRLLEDWQENHR